MELQVQLPGNSMRCVAKMTLLVPVFVCIFSHRGDVGKRVCFPLLVRFCPHLATRTEAVKFGRV